MRDMGGSGVAGAITSSDAPAPDSAYAWRRLAASLALSTIGGVGLWSAVIVLPTIEAEFGVGRGGASLPYTATMVGFAAGGVLMGRWADRVGIKLPLILGTLMLGVGFALAAVTQNYWEFVLAQALLIGMLGSSVTFGPLVADVSLWFLRKRGIAVAIVASGNYLAGAIWPFVLQRAIGTVGWRHAYMGVGAFCILTMLPLALLLRRRAATEDRRGYARKGEALIRPPVPPALLQGLLVLAGLSCCIAMSMPQVHIIAYCGDLGYGPARGAEMLSLMLGFGIFSRIASGFIADRIGGVATLLLSSLLQGVALLLYLFYDGLVSLYVISALFGLFQGGLVPMYAIIVRQYFSPQEAGTRLGIVLMATVFGMALGGWMSGVIFDLTGSYQAAFVNGLIWNLVNVSIALWLLTRPAGGPRTDEPRLLFARHGANGRG